MGMNEHASQSGEQEHSGAEQGYTATADRIAENMAIAALRVGDATQDLVTLINSLVTAGKELESALAIQRELGAASLKAVEQAREAAEAASSSAREAHDARAQSNELLGRMDHEYGTVSGLVGDLRDRIAALSVLGSPLPVREHHSEPEQHAEHEPESKSEPAAEAENSAESHDEPKAEDESDMAGEKEDSESVDDYEAEELKAAS
jgi:hypothetical protein